MTLNDKLLKAIDVRPMAEVFFANDVKEAIKEYQEWIDSKKLHCKSCCKDKLRDIFGGELCKEKGK